jgi:hypothetical protein
VFTAFTLSQAGMVRHWLASPGGARWRSILINATGAVTTGVVLVVVATVKFTHGAWIVLLAAPILVMLMLSTKRHYKSVSAQLKQLPKEARARPVRILVLVAHHDEGTDRALRYAELVNAESVTCIHAEEPRSDDLAYTWDAAHPGHSLEILPGENDSVSRRVLERVRSERDLHPGAVITAILADRVRIRSILAPFAHRHSLAIKSRLLFERGVVVTDLNVLRRQRRAKLRPVPISHIEQVVLISDLTRPIREALTYAEHLGPPVTAVHIDVDSEQREKIERQWEAAGYDFPLVMIPSPYRNIVDPLVGYLRERRRTASPGTLISAVIPEFVVPGRVTQLLHNQTGLAIKGVLAGEAGIAVTSVPFHLSPDNGVG